MNRMTDDQFYDRFGKEFGMHILDKATTELPAMLIERFPDRAQDFTADYVTRYAIAIFTLVITQPPHMLALLATASAVAPMVGQQFSLFVVAMDALTKYPERCEPAFWAEKFKSGFAGSSPTLSHAITDQIIIDTARLCLYDWLSQDELAFEDLDMDTHFYLDMAMLVHDVKPDMNALDQEMETFLREGDTADIPPELIERLKTARAEWKQRKG